MAIDRTLHNLSELFHPHISFNIHSNLHSSKPLRYLMSSGVEIRLIFRWSEVLIVFESCWSSSLRFGTHVEICISNRGLDIFRQIRVSWAVPWATAHENLIKINVFQAPHLRSIKRAPRIAWCLASHLFPSMQGPTLLPVSHLIKQARKPSTVGNFGTCDVVCMERQRAKREL